MIMICYDFSNDKVRAKFAKFLNQYGRKVQYSVYEIRNSKRILENILEEIEYKFKKNFTSSDSVLIFQICEADKKKIIRYGFPSLEEKELIML